MQVEGGWNLSASFPVDSVGEYTLRLTRQVDVGKLRHISTRRSSEYEVEIPRMEVGFPIRGQGTGYVRFDGFFFSCTSIAATYCCVRVGPSFCALFKDETFAVTTTATCLCVNARRSWISYRCVRYVGMSKILMYRIERFLRFIPWHPNRRV